MKLPGLDSEVRVKFLCNFYLLESHLRTTSGQDCSPAGRGGRAGCPPSLQSEIFTKPKGETRATCNSFKFFAAPANTARSSLDVASVTTTVGVWDFIIPHACETAFLPCRTRSRRIRSTVKFVWAANTRTMLGSVIGVSGWFCIPLSFNSLS